MIKHFEGEEVFIEGKKEITVLKLSDDFINDKYRKGEVRIVTEQGRFQLNTVLGIVESDDYILDPEFQRRHRWNQEKKSKLIESFIMNVPIPPIFLYEIEYSTYEVMDGLQRLTAISEFYKDDYALIGLEEWPELNNKRYSELPTQVKKGIDRRYLSSMILLNETAGNDPKEAMRLKQLVFERINSGGEKLEPQETRNALYNGPLNKLCIEIARDEYFCEIWQIPWDNVNESSKELIENNLFKKMEDVELVLRFFAFRHISLWESMSLERFLDKFLQEGNLLDQQVLSKLKDLFEETAKLIYDIFGKNAIFLYRQRDGVWNWYNRPTKVVYDPLFQVVSSLLDKKEILILKKYSIREAVSGFYQENYEFFGGRNTGKKDVEKRIDLFSKFLKKFLGE